MANNSASKPNALRDLCRLHRVVSLYAFGSRAVEARDWLHGVTDAPLDGPSDLDLGAVVEDGTTLTARARVKLTAALERFFGVTTVDLLLVLEADPFVAVDVIRGELLYCDDENRQALEELFVLRRAGDLAFFERQRLDGLLSGELRR